APGELPGEALGVHADMGWWQLDLANAKLPAPVRAAAFEAARPHSVAAGLEHFDLAADLRFRRCAHFVRYGETGAREAGQVGLTRPAAIQLLALDAQPERTRLDRRLGALARGGFVRHTTAQGQSDDPTVPQ